MSTTFLLSNMSPQTAKLNQRIWKKLEEQVRDLVIANGEAWIITGNVFLSSDSQFVSPSEFIGPNSVAVPTHCFKAILSCDDTGEFSMFAFLFVEDCDSSGGLSVSFGRKGTGLGLKWSRFWGRSLTFLKDLTIFYIPP